MLKSPKPGLYPRELKSLGDHLRKHRLDLGLSQKEVALPSYGLHRPRSICAHQTVGGRATDLPSMLRAAVGQETIDFGPGDTLGPLSNSDISQVTQHCHGH